MKNLVYLSIRQRYGQPHSPLTPTMSRKRAHHQTELYSFNSATSEQPICVVVADQVTEDGLRVTRRQDTFAGPQVKRRLDTFPAGQSAAVADDFNVDDMQLIGEEDAAEMFAEDSRGHNKDGRTFVSVVSNTTHALLDAP